jgi:hypothetical protein
VTLTPIELPADACCCGCGYALRDLPEPRCPECGRAFDPARPRSYTRVTARQRRVRRWVMRGAVLLVFGVLIWSLFPRCFQCAELEFTCEDCGAIQRYFRKEAIAPTYVPFRYSWLTWEWMETGQTNGTSLSTTCRHTHRLIRLCLSCDVRDTGGQRAIGWASATMSAREIPGYPVEASGLNVGPSTIWQILQLTCQSKVVSIGGDAPKASAPSSD